VKQITVLWGGKKQAVYLLDEPHVVIGRGRGAHIALDDNPIVSRQHAVIRKELDAHVVEDLGGTNGTFVNDQRIDMVRLRDGDRVVLGKHTLRYEASTGEGISLQRRTAGSAEADFQATSTVGALPQGQAEPPWAQQKATPNINAAGANEATMAASREELEAMLEQMKLKSQPHLSYKAPGGPIAIVPLKGGKASIGHGDGHSLKLPGSRWFGAHAATVAQDDDKFWIVARSPFWNPVQVGASKVRKKRKLRDGDTITAAGVKIRFSVGEQD
jgi:pSer/pThr/pTyr-binding forkhead associated (FHA) protein